MPILPDLSGKINCAPCTDDHPAHPNSILSPIQSATRPQLIHNRALKSYAKLNQFIIAHDLSGLYRIWLLCRAIDPAGSGVVSMKAMQQQLERVGLNSAHLIRAKRHKSSDVFLEIHQDKIIYRSQVNVCIALGVKPGRAILIPHSSLSSLQEFKAALYAAWIAAHDELYISRRRLTSLFRVSEDTLRRWEKRIGVDVTYNVVKVNTGDLEASQEYIPEDARLDQFDRLGKSYTWDYRGATYYRTVNQYQAHSFIRCRRGMTRKVSKAVNQAGIPVSDHGDGTDQADQPNRIFFSNASTPRRYQERTGACMRGTTCSIKTPRGNSNLWEFSTRKPVSNNWILTGNH